MYTSTKNTAAIETVLNKDFNIPAAVGQIETQKGAVLILALVMLTILTLIGVSSMSSSSLELKVASNAQEHNIAFQAAQSRLAFTTSIDDANPINFFIPIDFSANPNTWPVQTCNPLDGCPDDGGGTWVAAATVTPLDCGTGIGNSLEEGKGVANRYFAVEASGETGSLSSRSTQVRALRYPVKNC